MITTDFTFACTFTMYKIFIKILTTTTCNRAINCAGQGAVREKRVANWYQSVQLLSHSNWITRAGKFVENV